MSTASGVECDTYAEGEAQVANWILTQYSITESRISQSAMTGILISKAAAVSM